jgi:hypothetical protein
METFRFTDAAGTTRLDLMNSSGWMLGRGLDLGTGTVERTYLTQPPNDGAVLASSYRGIVTMQVPLILFPTGGGTPATMKSAIEALITELNRSTNYIRFKPTGYTAAGIGEYILYTYRSNIPTLLRGLDTPSPFFMKRGGPSLFLEIDREPVMGGAGVGV